MKSGSTSIAIARSCAATTSIDSAGAGTSGLSRAAKSLPPPSPLPPGDRYVAHALSLVAFRPPRDPPLTRAKDVCQDYRAKWAIPPQVTKENTMKIARVTAAVFALVLLGSSTMAPRTARANGCKPDGQRCQTNISCCSRDCMKPASPPGKAKPLFGTCCTPTTCTAQGATCGMIPDGDCGDMLTCGTCTAPQTCGGGGTANVCGCTPSTMCPAGDNCGSVSDGCGGTVSCGTCTAPDTCGGGGTPNVCGCTPTTCTAAGVSCGTISDGCGGTLSCETCE